MKYYEYDLSGCWQLTFNPRQGSLYNWIFNLHHLLGEVKGRPPQLNSYTRITCKNRRLWSENDPLDELSSNPIGM